MGHLRFLQQGWAATGQLTAAAQEALQLQGEPRPLRRRMKRWAAADFRDLPPVVMPGASAMPGTRGAYAASTGTIYLNQDWLLGAVTNDPNLKASDIMLV